MALIQEADRAKIKEHFQQLQHPVKIVLFTQEFECQFCRDTHQLMEEVSELTDKLSLEVYDFVANQDEVDKYNIDKIPATVIVGEKDYGIRFYGIPSGYEFSSLLDAIIMISKRDSGLSEETRTALRQVKHPLHLQVFVTPTCPYCPRAVHLAHQFAMESDRVVADMVEAIEFPQLSQRYGVMGVPRTIANDQTAAEGALPESHLLNQILLAADRPKAA